MKKLIPVFAILIFFQMHAFAADISELVSGAFEKSPQVAQYERTRESSLLSRSLTNLSGVTYSLSVSDQTPAVDFDSGKKYLPALKAVMNYSDKNNNQDLSLSVSSGAIELNRENTSYNLRAEAGFSKTFDFSSSDKTDYTDVINGLRIELTYGKSMLNFKKTLINDVITVIRTELNVAKAEKSYATQKEKYENSLLTGDFAEGSANQLSQKLSLDSTLASLNSQKSRLEDLYASFEKTYGFAYYTVDSAENADFNLSVPEGENTELRIARLSLDEAKKALAEKTGSRSSLKVALNAAPAFYFADNAYEKTELSMSGGLTLTVGNFNLSSRLTGQTKDLKFTSPTLYVGGSYSDGNIKSQTDKVEINKLENNVITAQSNLEDAEFSYSKSVKTLNEDIRTLKFDLEQAEIKDEYCTKVLDYTQRLFDSGLVTETELEDARTEAEYNRAEQLLLKLRALSLATDIELLML